MVAHLLIRSQIYLVLSEESRACRDLISDLIPSIVESSCLFYCCVSCDAELAELSLF